MIGQMCSSTKEWQLRCRRKVKVCGCQKLKVKRRAVTLSHVTTGQQTLMQYAESTQKVCRRQAMRCCSAYTSKLVKQTIFLHHQPTNFPFPKTGIQNITL